MSFKSDLLGLDKQELVKFVISYENFYNEVFDENDPESCPIGIEEYFYSVYRNEK